MDRPGGNVKSVEAISLDLMCYAALAGNFDPYRYLPRALAVDDEARILSTLGRVCDEIFSGGEILWRLHEGERQQQLRAMAREGTIARNARRWPPLQTDRYGSSLVACLTGALSTPEKVPEEALEDAVTAAAAAASALSGIDPDHSASVQQFYISVRRRVTAKARDQQFDTILPTELFGRDTERRLLDNFIAAGHVDHNDCRLEEPPDPALSERAFLLTGTPGSGKSAFVTDLVSRNIKGEDWVFLLDFDRPVLALGGEMAWLQDLTRHVGQADPDLASQLSALRQDVREEMGILSAASGTASAVIQGVSKLRLGLIEAFSKRPPPPLVLVLDTFEEVVARSPANGFNDDVPDTLFHQVMDFAARLSTTHPDNAAIGATLFPHVRVIVSGRSPPPVHKDALARWFCAHLELPDLDVDSARQLLEARAREGNYRLRNNEKRLARAVAAIGGHPLNLILFERHVRSMRAAEIDDTLSDLEKNGIAGMHGVEGTRSLFNRFLRRIRCVDMPEDVSAEMIARVAHPGLVLREIDQHLLREVVGPAVDVSFASDEAAATTLRILANQVWLVSVVSEAPFKIRHRSDVRNIMLPMMLAGLNRDTEDSPAPADNVPDDSETDLHSAVRRMFELAIGYFSDRAERGDTSAAAEIGYLKALRGERDIFIEDSDLAASVAGTAGQDIALMPLTVRALLKFHSDGPSSLNTDEIGALPDALAIRAGLAVGERGSRTGTGAARKTSMRRRKSTPKSTSTGGTSGSEYEEMAGDFLEGTGDGGMRPSEPADFMELFFDEALQDQVITEFRNGQFSDVANAGWSALGRATGFDQKDIGRLLTSSDLSGHWIWLTALATYAAPDLDSRDRSNALYRMRDGFERAAENEGAAFRRVAATLIHLLRDSENPPLNKEWLGETVITRFDSDEYRDLSEWRYLGMRSVYYEPSAWLELVDEFPTRFVRLFEPVLLEYLSDFNNYKSKSSKIVDDMHSLFASKEAYDVDWDDTSSINRWAEQSQIRLAGDQRFVPDYVLTGVLRGTSPELHDVVTNALLYLPEPDLFDLMDRLVDQARIWPQDIDPKMLRQYSADQSISVGLLARIVLHADRCGLLGTLLHHGGATQETRLFDDIGRILEKMDERLGGRPPV